MKKRIKEFYWVPLVAVYLIGIPVGTGRFYAGFDKTPVGFYDSASSRHAEAQVYGFFMGGILWPVYWPFQYAYKASGGK